MPLPDSVRIIVEQPFPESIYQLKAYWTPADGTAERMVILRSDPSQRELASDKARVEQLLQYVYDQGRAEATLRA